MDELRKKQKIRESLSGGGLNALKKRAEADDKDKAAFVRALEVVGYGKKKKKKKTRPGPGKMTDVDERMRKK